MSEVVRPPRSLKIVFYGPSCAGKTANLEALHRMAGARRGHELLTIKSEKESTLFFDLLPFVLDGVAGLPLELKLYTVPGQVRYDATRKVVLDGADAVVFVADSRPSRRENNIWSLQNLRMNMRHRCMDSERVPVLFQINRRDAADAASAAEVAEWLGVGNEHVTPAIARTGEGVLETLKAACFALPPHVVGEPQDLERAFARYEPVRLDTAVDGGRASAPIIVRECDPLEGALETSVRLGEQRSAAAARSRRLEREARGFRRLGELLCELAPGSERTQLLADLIAVAKEVVQAACVSLTVESPAGPLLTEAVVGADADPLSESSAGRTLLRRMLAAQGPSVVDDLSEHCEAFALPGSPDYRAAAAVRLPLDANHLLVAYANRPDGNFSPDDVHFLQSVARHIASGLEKLSAYREAEERRESLERSVRPQEQDRRRGRSRRAVDRVRDQFLTVLADEMTLPLAALASSLDAIAQTDEGTLSPDSRGEMQRSLDLLTRQSEKLQRLLRLGQPPNSTTDVVAAATLVDRAIELAGHGGVRKRVDPDAGTPRVDPDAAVRALANLIDNAIRYTEGDKPVSVHSRAASLSTVDGEREALTIRVLDRGPGLDERTRECLFAPFAPPAAAPVAKRAGLGIGLYESLCVARAHGGKLEFFSRKGGGSEFRLTLPLEPVVEPDAMEVSRG